MRVPYTIVNVVWCVVVKRRAVVNLEKTKINVFSPSEKYNTLLDDFIFTTWEDNYECCLDFFSISFFLSYFHMILEYSPKF